MLPNISRSTGLLFAAMLLATLCTGRGGGLIGPTIAHAQPEETDAMKELLVPKLPADAHEVSGAIKSTKAGETVTLHGYIPMSDGFGASGTIQLVEQPTAVPAKTGDAVAVPKATLKLEDSSGKPLKGLEGRHGLKAGAEVFITGKVESTNGNDTIVVKAESLHVPRSSVPAGFFVDKAPEKSIDVSEARKSGTHKIGDEVILRGRIGGSKTPFVGGRAVFTLMGRGLKACSENPGDACKTPWDYCCETKTDITAHSATIQISDDKGQVLRTDMKGRRGMKEMTEIVVTGKVAVSDGKLLVVNATSIVVVN